ncbi:uncharacterized protein LOC121253694 isoform X3 [Juglans microcarpa x Juglans regia]|uniref:uncharacterized protein LOC121253694 isoform X3 n=1 Tax=Juglans microcarpa x Juglans regia TaxID=2249226 RepID=UPI001B7DC5FA|nr:uncharacterized protein LOC121253694 isoform X3 [Juglans microcarpa x Juglans regia]
MADEVRGERGHDYMEKTTLWQELDLSFEEEWKCTGDSVRYKKRLENERVFEFLVGLNQDLDDVRGRILGRRPLPSTREVFSEVRQEENRRKVMLKEIFSTGHIGPEMSALVSWGTLSRSGSRQDTGNHLTGNQVRTTETVVTKLLLIIKSSNLKEKRAKIPLQPVRLTLNSWSNFIKYFLPFMHWVSPPQVPLLVL